MAEFVGLAASVCTLAEVGRKLGKVIRSCAFCPAEILALNNELSDLKLVFAQADKVCTTVPERYYLRPFHRRGRADYT